MADKFHKSHCGLRHGGEVCTCGYIAPKTDKQIIKELQWALAKSVPWKQDGDDFYCIHCRHKYDRKANRGSFKSDHDPDCIWVEVVSKMGVVP